MANLLSGLYRNATNQHYSTQEQECARAWEESEAALRDGAYTNEPTVANIVLTAGQTCVLSIMTQALIQDHLARGNILARRLRETVRPGSTSPQWKIGNTAQSFKAIEIGKTLFCALDSRTAARPLDNANLFSMSDTFVEFRPTASVYKVPSPTAESGHHPGYSSTSNLLHGRRAISRASVLGG